MDCELRLDHIAVPAGRRAVDPDAVTSLKKSIAALGLQHRITVCKRDDAYVLVAGAHRLEAFRQLGKDRIPATVVDFDEFQAELFEIAENLVRNQLSPAQQAAAFARQKVNYEDLHPETKHGAIGKGRVINGAAKAERYTKLAADATGISEAAVQRSAHRGETLGQELLGKIVGTSLDVGTEIDALIKLPAAELLVLVNRAMAGDAVSAVKAQAVRLVEAKPTTSTDEAVPVAVAPAKLVEVQPVAPVVDEVEHKAPAPAKPKAVPLASPSAASSANLATFAAALLVQADEFSKVWQKLHEGDDDILAKDDTLAKAFLMQADVALAMADYRVGPVTDDVVEKARLVKDEWEGFFEDLEAEYKELLKAEGPILDEDAA
jgi:hypothetical protein